MKNNISRRSFIKKSVFTVATGSLALGALNIKDIIANVSENYYESNSTKTINLSDYPELSSVGGYAMITGKVIIIRTSQSKFVALNITCTHKKCDVEFDGSGFECPCHGSEFDKNGNVKSGPAKKNLKSYKTTYNSSENTLTINM